MAYFFFTSAYEKKELQKVVCFFSAMLSMQIFFSINEHWNLFLPMHVYQIDHCNPQSLLPVLVPSFYLDAMLYSCDVSVTLSILTLIIIISHCINNTLTFEPSIINQVCNIGPKYNVFCWFWNEFNFSTNLAFDSMCSIVYSLFWIVFWLVIRYSSCLNS